MQLTRFRSRSTAGPWPIRAIRAARSASVASVRSGTGTWTRQSPAGAGEPEAGRGATPKGGPGAGQAWSALSAASPMRSADSGAAAHKRRAPAKKQALDFSVIRIEDGSIAEFVPDPMDELAGSYALTPHVARSPLAPAA